MAVVLLRSVLQGPPRADRHRVCTEQSQGNERGGLNASTSRRQDKSSTSRRQDASSTSGAPRSPSSEGSSQAPSIAAEHARQRNAISFRLPVVGPVSLPSAPQLAWYAGVGALAVVGVVDPPIALVLALGKALSDDRSNKTLQDFGDTLEEAG